ncbi:MAG: two-component system response regulator [Epsilonproteobacteria bacterium]|nr:MAG: two-component system response regulator [Campylobacterota bacterium]
MKMNYNILIVDDVLDNIQVAMNMLKEDNYELSFATSGEMALELVKENSFDLILLDVMMPGIDGFEVCEKLKLLPGYADVPVIFLTAKTDIDSVSRAFEVGGVDYILKPFHINELLARVSTHLELYKAKMLLMQHNINIDIKREKEKQRLLSELELNQQEMIYLLAEMMEVASDETGKHVRRVAEIARLLAHYHESVNEEDTNIIFHASPMHDIGKVLLPLEILHKDSALTDEEFESMKSHPSKAHEFLSKSQRKYMKTADIIAYEHHEKWDGTGYPRNLKGEDIHLFGRIVAIADVFDALTHKRKYKGAWSVEDSAQYIIDKSGTHFDPFLVNIFKENLDEFIAISKI